jgi:siderophore synthetase component
MTDTATRGLADRARRTADDLARLRPDLVAGFRAALPEAARIVGARLAGALHREGLVAAAPAGRRHGFGRVEVTHPGAETPADLLPAGLAPRGLRAELDDAVVNLAVALTRRAATPAPAGGADPDEAALAAERLAVTGHNLHPCGRTRLGWDLGAVLAHDLEADATAVGFVAVRDGALLGDDLGLRAAHPHLPAAPPGYRLHPVHPWQRDHVLPRRHAGLLRDGTLRILDAELPAAPTAALRTLLLPPTADGTRRYLKLSLDIQVTSTRRGISTASTRNGPAVSALLRRLTAAEDRLVLLDETAGAALPAGSGRDLSAIARAGLTGRIPAGERAVPGGALPATDPATGRSVVAGLVHEYGGDALAWLDAYARLLLPPLLRLAAAGVAVEAHLQNCVPTFAAGAPRRLALRDFAGLRLHLPRLAAAGHDVRLWPGSVVGTDRHGVLMAKLGYTALQAHLGELIVRLAEAPGLDEDAAWRAVRAVVDETYAELPGAAADHAFLTAATMPHKALVTMRLTDDGDRYVPVPNPLHAAR